MKYEKDLQIIISEKILDKLKACVNKASPNEACGLIFGDVIEIKVEDGFQYQHIAKKFECIESDQKSPVAFLIENIEKLNQILVGGMVKYNLKLVSIFHSHPSGSYPSGVDETNMRALDKSINRAFKNRIWTIMDASSREMNGFIYLNGEFLQVNVILKD